MKSGRDLFAVGKIVKAFGIKGDVVVQPMTDVANRFKKLHTVFVGRSGAEAEQAQIERVQIESRGVRLKIAGINVRRDAEKLVGSLLFVDGTERIRIPEGTFFIHDIIGISVVDQEGHPIGVVKEVLRLPANDVYVMDCNGRDIMMPAVKEFIINVNVKAKSMTVKLINGMVE